MSLRARTIAIIVSALLAGAIWGAAAALLFAQHGSILSYSYGGTP